jgi:two-component system sensor histidine kinase AgrC
MSLVELILPTIIFNFFHLILSSKIIKEKINIYSLKSLFVFLFLTLIIPLSIMTFDGIFRSIVNFLCLFLAYYFIYNKGINKAFATTFIVFFFIFISDTSFSILLTIYSEIFNFSFNLGTDLLLYSLSNFIIGLMMLLIYNIKFFREIANNILLNYEKTKFTKIMLISLLLLVILSNKNFLLFGRDVDYTLNILIQALFCLIIYFLMKEKDDNIILSSKYEQMINYLENYEKELSKKSMIIHEFKNQLVAIKGFNDGNNIQLDQYLETIIKENQTESSKLLKNMENVPKGGLKGLIYYKLSYLADEKINVLINVSSNVKKNLFNRIDSNLYKEHLKIVGILLDNAIESAKESNEKQISLEIFYKSRQFHFILSNTYNGAIDIEKLGNIKYSTKGKNRGYGLALAKK